MKELEALEILESIKNTLISLKETSKEEILSGLEKVKYKTYKLPWHIGKKFTEEVEDFTDSLHHYTKRISNGEKEPQYCIRELQGKVNTLEERVKQLESMLVSNNKAHDSE